MGAMKRLAMKKTGGNCKEEVVEDSEEAVSIV